MQDLKAAHPALPKRPSSSPSRIDPRTKVPLDELNIDCLYSEDGTMSEISDMKSVRSLKTKEQPRPPSVPEKECYSILHAPTPIIGNPRQSLHPKSVKTTVPHGRIIRPISAGPLGSERTESQAPLLPSANRPFTAPVKLRAQSVKSIPASIAPSLPGASVLAQNKSLRQSPIISSAYSEASGTPMLMYPQAVKTKAAELKELRKNRQEPMKFGADGRPLGKVSQYNQPMRDHATFELRTHIQEAAHAVNITQGYKDQKQKVEKESEKRKRAAWVAMATGRGKTEVKPEPTVDPLLAE